MQSVITDEMRQWLEDNLKELKILRIDENEVDAFLTSAQLCPDLETRFDERRISRHFEKIEGFNYGIRSRKYSRYTGERR